ncbi:MAG: putative ABC-type sugar transport system, periplasmic component, partial [Chloroflexi bacterium]|nr:putative ABC-type sugar transport system, periplasmic component [Chloroflexota bacterium]
MSKKILFTLMSLTVVLSMLLAAPAPEATEPPAPEATEPPAPEATEPPAETGAIKVGFLAGVQDPFYFTMQRGAAQAAADLGVELVVQIPDNWNATVQTPMLEAMVARGDLDFLFLAPVDKEAMVAPLQAA